MDYYKELSYCVSLAYTAGAMSLDFFKKHHKTMEFEEKDGNAGPVTEADKAIDKFMCDSLRSNFPNAIVVGEESVANCPDDLDFADHHTFFVDPIDGTKEYIQGKGEWAVQIGLSDFGEPKLGVVYDPVGDLMYFATQGQGAFRIKGGSEIARLSTSPSPSPYSSLSSLSSTSSTPLSESGEDFGASTAHVGFLSFDVFGDKLERLSVRKESTIEDCIVVSSHNQPNTITQQRIMKELSITREIYLGSFGLKVAKIAEGAADIYFGLRCKNHFWDFCGPEVIAREAGAALVILPQGETIWYGGRDTKMSKPLMAASRHLLPELMPKLLKHFS